MNRIILSVALGSSLLIANGNRLAAQGLPTSQPKYLSVIRESVKPGRGPEHAKHEAGWPAAYEKAQSKDYYLALVSLTGSPEAWYLQPWESHAALEESMNSDKKDEALSKELDKLVAQDGEYLSSLRILHARARPELSMGAFPDIAKARYFTVTVFNIKPGHDETFVKAAKAWGAASKRSAPDATYRVYEVISGMPGPSYLIFSSHEKLGELDKVMADGDKTFEKAKASEKKALKNFSRQALLQAEEIRFRLDPRQSYVPKETRDKDPEFWSSKQGT